MAIARGRGRDVVQALHGLPRPPDAERRRDLPRAAAGGGGRRPRLPPRRERTRPSTRSSARPSRPGTRRRASTRAPGRRRPRPRRSGAASRSPEMAGAALYIVHLSSATALEQIAAARERGLDILAETCPQYLLLTEAAYDAEPAEAAKFVMSPPLRTPADQEALWAGLERGDIQVVATDHCPFTTADKARGLDDFSRIPNGAPGIEHRMALLYDAGVAGGRLVAGAVRGRHRRHARPDLRPLAEEGRDRRGCRRRHRRLRPRRDHDDLRGDAPHAGGLQSVRRTNAPRRHRPRARPRRGGRLGRPVRRSARPRPVPEARAVHDHGTA